MARAATGPELANFRVDGQWAKLMLAVIQPAAVFAARVAQDFDSDDEVMEVAFDNITTGAYTDVVAGMTLYVGSSAGAYDVGMARVKSATSTKLTIARTSEIDWADNLYLTVVDEFGLWARHTLQEDELTYMDDDIAYSDQHANMNPVPVLGPDAVLELSGATVDFTPDASDSWVLGSTISAYSWSAPGASATSDLATATPTITYDTAGTYRVSCEITAANGKTTTGYRTIYVWDANNPPVTQFEAGSILGDYEDGGWGFSVTMYAEAGISTVRDRAKVILFAEDHYGSTQTSIGPISGYENIIAVGWIAGETIRMNPSAGTVSFEVKGPHWWLDHIPAYPAGALDTTSAPTTWADIQSLTVDKAIFHLLYWHSTACQVLDIALTDDTRRIAAGEGSVGSLWKQIQLIAETKVLARPCCDRYGRLFVEIDTQYLDTSDRSAIPTVMEISTQDWRDELEIERRTVPAIGSAEVTGTAWDGSEATPYRALAPGKVFKHHGGSASVAVCLTDSDQAEAISGMILARENNEYPSALFHLAANNRLIDICPRQYVTATIAAADTPRGITWTAKKLIPRALEMIHENGVLSVDLECEGETSGNPGVSIEVPGVQPPNENVDESDPGELPSFPLFPPGNIWFPPTVSNPPEDVASGCRGNTSAAANGPYELWPDKYFLTTEDSDKLKALIYYPAMIRQAAADHNTRLRIIGRLSYKFNGVWYQSKSTAAWISHALDAEQSPVLTGLNEYSGYSFDDRDVYFEPAGDLDVRGFDIELVDPDNTPAGYSRTFNFGTGTDGWEKYCDNDDYARWNSGKLELRGGPGWINQAWRWYPERLYAVTGATINATQVYYSNCFVGIGLAVVETEIPLTYSWRYTNARYSGNIGYTVQSGDDGKRVLYFGWDLNLLTSNWLSLDDVVINGFTSQIAERKLTIEKIELYNICEFQE